MNADQDREDNITVTSISVRIRNDEKSQIPCSPYSNGVPCWLHEMPSYPVPVLLAEILKCSNGRIHGKLVIAHDYILFHCSLKEWLNRSQLRAWMMSTSDAHRFMMMN